MKTTQHRQKRRVIYRHCSMYSGTCTTGFACKVTAMLIVMVLFGSFAGAQYDIPWETQDGGGGPFTGDTYALWSVVSQPDADILSGSGYTLIGGFLSGIGPTIPLAVIHFYFLSNAEGWTFAGAIPSYDAPSTLANSGYIGLYPSHSTNCFSYWYSPDMGIQDDKMYRARWLLASTAATANETVQSRLRINQKGSWQSWIRVVNSNLEQAPYQDNPKYYDLYFDPDVTGSGDNLIVLNFDILSFDPGDDTNSWLLLDEVRVDEVAVTPGNSVVSYNFSASTQGWGYAGAIPSFDEPGTITSGDHLGLNPIGSTNCFSYWLSPDIPIEEDKKYRAWFEIGSSVTDADTCLQTRMRVNQKGSWQAWYRGVNSNNGQAPNSTTPKTYSVIFNPDVCGCGDENVTFSFDILSFDMSDDIYSWLYLESAGLQEVTINP